MAYFDKDKIMVNGPINLVRLEGKVNNFSKVIYLFLDQHYALHQQTECDNIFSLDINTYLANSFMDLNNEPRKYDFFLEIVPTSLQDIEHGFSHNTPVNGRVIYIHEVLKLFRKIFKYNPSKNKVSISDKFKNIRLHYIDIRDYFEQGQYDNLSHIAAIADDFNSKNNIKPSDLEHIIDSLNSFKEHCHKLRNMLSKQSSVSKQKKQTIIKFGKIIANQEFTTSQLHLINKMFNRYNDNNIKKKIGKQRQILSDNLSELIKDSHHLMNECESILIKVKDSTNKLVKDNTYGVEYSYGLSYHMINRMIFYIRDHINILLDKFTFFYTRFVDVFFLRRFLDKKYITNAIAYTGSYHSNVYIEILTQEFGFKITHASYSKIENLRKLNEVILNKKANEMGEIFYPPIRSQCVDLTNLPPNFT